MAVIGCCHAVVLALVCTLPTLSCRRHKKLPDLSIVALKPSGLVISMPATDPEIHGVYVNGYLIKRGNDVIHADMMSPKYSYFHYQNNTAKIEVGDMFEYNISIAGERTWLKRSSDRYIFKELIEPASYNLYYPVSTTVEPAPKESRECRPTSTSVLWPGCMKTICSGQIIFEDNFDTLREDLWTIEEYIPSNPEYPFVSYQRLTVSVENGTLRIQPQLQENLPGFDSAAITYSTLDLTSGCTRPGSCVVGGDGGHIIPPIASGRITSKLFSFKYGSIEVRAKVPQGDWLYPDILLESLLQKYGVDDYASGVLRIAGVLGNMILKEGEEEYGNKVLNGGPVMDFKCRTNLLVKKISTTEWGNDFHVYKLHWAPDTITLSVDGEEWGRIEVPTNGLQTSLPKDTCGLLYRTFLKAPMAPFDDYFNIILGLSAGGVSEFPDGVVSLNGNPKPWINTGRRARLDFYTAKDSWLPTWAQPALLVDYIRVRAL